MLHPQARAFLDLVTEKGIPPTHTLTPAVARAIYRERRGFTQPDPPPVAEVHALSADGPHGAIPLRLYRPLGSAQDAQLPVLVYYHGGGWVIGDLETHDTLCRQLANAAGCAVVAVDYRMGPEHHFPAAVDDCIAATRWVHDHASTLNLDATCLAVGGDSAGGNLAAVVTIAARESGTLPIVFQLLIYPATDQRYDSASHRTLGEGYLLTTETMVYFRGHYIAEAAQHNDWRASPLLHPDLSHLPPAFVLTAGYDPLRDEGLAYAQRLTEAGVRSTQLCFERQIHGFILMGKVLDEADTAVGVCATVLRDALSRER